MRESIDKVGFNRKIGSLGLMAGAVFMLAGCVGGEDTSMARAATTIVNVPAGIAQESADNYDDNENGLITGATLSHWIGDWDNRRPDGVNGRLIILQTAAGGAGAEYIKSIPGKVHTYEVPSSEWVQTRSNGVTVTSSMVPDGPTMDAFLKKYGIDPVNDMIVCAMGGASNPLAMRQGRCWYMFRYWGVDSKNLALLNGGNSWNLSSANMLPTDFSTSASVPPNNGRSSVKLLPQDNTSLMATIDDMLDIVTPTRGNDTLNGALIWDARSLSQYSAGEARERGEREVSTDSATACAAAYCGPVADYMTTFQGNASRQGHPNGTLQLQYTHMLYQSAAEGFRYKNKAELAAYLNGNADSNGMQFVDHTYQPVGIGNAYQPGDTLYMYCETTFRAMITGMVTAVVLGLPTRFYDGAMTEWNSLSNINTTEGTPILPATSPWRTDLDRVSFFVASNDPSKIEARAVDNAYAVSADAIVQADRAYKGVAAASTGGSGGGVSAPSNPCGG